MYYFSVKHRKVWRIYLYLDADATESSSGGESADEHEQYPAGAKFYAPIKERAKYRYISGIQHTLKYDVCLFVCVFVP